MSNRQRCKSTGACSTANQVAAARDLSFFDKFQPLAVTLISVMLVATVITVLFVSAVRLLLFSEPRLDEPQQVEREELYAQP